MIQGSRDYGVSPVIGMILLVAIVVVMAAVVGTVVFGLGDVTSGKVVGVQPQYTGNPAVPIQVMMWGGPDLTEMESISVSVVTIDGVRTGTAENNTVFLSGVAVPIMFDEGFRGGRYPVTITAKFTDGTEQVIYMGTLSLGDVSGRVPVEVSNRAVVLISCEPVMGSIPRIKIYDRSEYGDWKIVSSKLEFGDGSTLPDFGKWIGVDNNTHNYYLEPGVDSIDVIVTYTVYYDDGKATTARQAVTVMRRYGESDIGKYINQLKINQGTLKTGKDVDLRTATDVTIWRDDIKGWYGDGKSLQISIGSTALGATTVARWNIDVTGAPVTIPYPGDKPTIYVIDTKSSKLITAKVTLYDAQGDILATHNFTIHIRDRDD